MKPTTAKALPVALLLTALLGAAGCATQPVIPASVPLWANGAPGSAGQTSPEIDSIRHEVSTQVAVDMSFPIVSNVNNPSITPFLPPPAMATGAAVIIAPGGGHQFLAIEHEGYAVARVLADHGVAAFVLKYRLAKAPHSPYTVQVHALMDIQRAIRLVRSHGADWNVDPHRVGVMGFSAGGELALLAATQFDHPVAGSNDDVDQLDCRPDFQALLYPGGLTNPQTVPLTIHTPPAFLACASNDRPTISLNLAQYYLRLKALGVPAELHIYNSGGHGFGVRPGNKPVNHWTDVFMDWMADRRLLSTQ